MAATKNQFLPRHIAQRRQYDSRRYARHLSQSELNQRIRDVFLNLLRVNPEAKIDIGPITAESSIWMEKWTHVLEEMQLRHGPYPAGFTREILHREPFPDLASDLSRRAAARLSALGLKRGDVFIKFGKRVYMERLLEIGALRIQPASYFALPDHNGAVRDDELTLNFAVALTRDEVVKLVRNPQDVPPNAPEQRVDVKFQFPTDYWLYCVTNSVEPRLFVDFNADSCVIIRDRPRFMRMLREASRLALPGTVMRDEPAVYVDLLFPTAATITVPFMKHFIEC
ncbi:MAG: hypothetical protein ACYDD2_16710 [Candidatus Acidiferrales bacterium]